MAEETGKVFQLECAVQNYKWGKVGMKSEVAKLSGIACPGIEIKDGENYAELWMGTHGSGPSKIVGNKLPLDQWISDHPESLGEKICEHFGTKLPFLFKVLSVNQALSIQVHPNKTEAEYLHKVDPIHYKDDNHKPEIAIAITKFEALCGFRPIQQISSYLNEFPELKNLIGNEKVENLLKNLSKEALKCCFSALMTSDEETIKETLSKMVSRFESQATKGDEIGRLFLRLHSQFPGDVGCCGVFFFNYITLNPDEAIFLPANEPHAYLDGDCVECMACSDNVIRCGLTPKFKDVPQLVKCLTYICKGSKDQLFQGVSDANDSNITVFDPPIPDFTVRMIKFKGSTNRKLNGVNSASILIVIDGIGLAKHDHKTHKLEKGTVLFLSSSQSFDIVQETDNLLMFQAYCNL